MPISNKKYRDIFPDDPPDIIHGINCDCDDSCLEYSCACGFYESTNRICLTCPDCGKQIAPDNWDNNIEEWHQICMEYFRNRSLIGENMALLKPE